jgi:hypothetical protein
MIDAVALFITRERRWPLARRHDPRLGCNDFVSFSVAQALTLTSVIFIWIAGSHKNREARSTGKQMTLVS